MLRLMLTDQSWSSLLEAIEDTRAYRRCLISGHRAAGCICPESDTGQRTETEGTGADPSIWINQSRSMFQESASGPASGLFAKKSSSYQSQ